ncbi:hypothetical protein Tsubulata_000354 [Turnera subulata]|uniref:Uncharacterized protein n=1 Tax=Turnera subulata TaxID=218843 RepID=A0A9Q0F2I9_9ROSI|nr:hypothetical protein Tsubulata_000354 [Turnera subulata]
MQNIRSPSLRCLHFSGVILAAIVIQIIGAASYPVPPSNCYSIDNSSRLVDFFYFWRIAFSLTVNQSGWIGHPFEYDGQDTDLVVRFCKDVETRSQTGYVDFGRFDKYNHFTAGSGEVDFVQRYYNGDLTNCEQTPDKLGRTAEVNIICGSCSNGRCKGGLGCICNVSQESNCRVSIELAVPCEKPGPRIFQGFTVGFHPRSWEIVYNGLTQLGYEKAYRDFSFSTEQAHVTLYMTAIASLSALVKKPIIQVLPEDGLEVKLSGSAARGSPPTTLTPTILVLEWRCQEPRSAPYEVNVTIPIEGYEPIQFFLAKMCEHRQDEGEDSRRGWAIFGILSCIFIVASTLFCCGGFIYKTRVEHLRGIDALPGMTLLSACLETASNAGQGYLRPENLNSGYATEAVWEQAQPSASSQPQGTWKTNDRKYGSI